MAFLEPIAAAVDIGGTNTKIGIISKSGKILALKRFSTPKVKNMLISALKTEMSDLLKDYPKSGSFAGVGVTMAAFITGDGLITASAHLPQDLVGLDLKNELNQEVRANYYFSLDTPAPTLGEYYYGAGRGYNDMVYVTVSTGIGAGIIYNGTIFEGGLGWAGGIGHCIINENSSRICDGCGNYGCLESYAAKQGILTTAKETLALHPESAIFALTDYDLEKLTPEIIYDAAASGDKTAVNIFNSVGHSLGIGLSYIADILSPTRIVVGGGISRAGDFLLDPAREVVQTKAYPPKARQAEIVSAELGDLSSLYGAAAMVFFDIRVNC